MRQLDVVVAARRRDGQLTGRPVTMLATRNEALVAEAFARADRPGTAEVVPIRPAATAED